MNIEDDVANSRVGSADCLANASMDTIIGWLREQREKRPDVSLAELFDGKSVPVEHLTDIACIDLMQRRRKDQHAKAEDYTSDFPELANAAARLDLIDAEICVVRELGGSLSLQQYAERFPELQSQIAELLEMPLVGRSDLVAMAEVQHEHVEPPGGQIIQPDSPGDSGDFSLQGDLVNPPSVHHPQHGLTGTYQATHPIDVPEWFIGEQSVATGPGHWLIRGRDAQHGETLAMKVLELPLQFTSAQADQLLDACERAAKVRNPSWVVPAVAAIQSRHLAVIRPWIYANPWHHVTRTPAPSTRLRELAAVAYAMQSAHQVGATHGAIQPSNLLIDHDGKVQIVDSCSAIPCVQRWLNCDGEIASLLQRVTIDVQDLVKLAIADAIQWPRAWGEKLVSQLRAIAEQHPHEPCGRMGDAMMRWADKQPDPNSQPSSPSWRSRIANWISRDNGS